MAPRTHYAKSQEIVYQSMGTTARPKFKAVRVKLPVNKPSDIQTLASERSLPPVVDPPQDSGDQFGPNEGSSIPELQIPQRKTKKVLNHFSMYLWLNTTIEAIRLHERLAAREEAYVFGANLANEGRPRGRGRWSDRPCRSTGLLGMRSGAAHLALPGLHRQKCGLRSMLSKCTQHESFSSGWEVEWTALPARCALASRTEDSHRTRRIFLPKRTFCSL